MACPPPPGGGGASAVVVPCGIVVSEVLDVVVDVAQVGEPGDVVSVVDQMS